jgi:23S rRNA (adenine2503-C2)-methyltransferase
MEQFMKNNFYDFQYDEMVNLFSEAGQPKFRVKQLWQGIYKELINTPQEISTLPKSLISYLENNFTFNTIQPGNISKSMDHETEKILFQLSDSHAIETVRMTYRKRETICLSTQVGCAMNCSFCATGQMGLLRNLTAGEIVEQVMYYQRFLHEKDKKITNLVFMGMGEPFQNYSAFIIAANILNHAEGLQIGERRMTVSTVGLPDMIRRFADENRQINLAVSLHTVDDVKRSEIIPINKRYPVHEVLSACKYYLQQTNRRITFEYALIRDFNDSPTDAKELIYHLKGMLCHVNLINLNPVEDSPYQPTTPKAANEFNAIIEKSGIPVSLRLRRGIDIHAGCGQLANQNQQS